MFYSHFILAKKGPLGTIWIAAHLEAKLRKNQVADTNITESVDSILFSEVPIALRLSGHLLLGVVRIYSRKVNYLFQDCSEALFKIKQAFQSSAVDLPPEASKVPFHSITLPETYDFDEFDITFKYDAGSLGDFVDRNVSARDLITLQEQTHEDNHNSLYMLDERFPAGADPYSLLDETEEDYVRKDGSTAKRTTPALQKDFDTLEEDVLPPFQMDDIMDIDGDSFAPLDDMADREHIVTPPVHISTQGSFVAANDVATPMETFSPPQSIPEIEKLRAATEQRHATPLFMEHDEELLPHSDNGPDTALGNDNATNSGTLYEVEATPTMPETPVPQRSSSSIVDALENYGVHDDLLGDILGVNTPVLRVGSPQVLESAKRKRSRKKRKIFDEKLIISSVMMKKQLADTSDICRQRKKNPSSEFDVWRLRGSYHDEMFARPNLHGVSAPLKDLYRHVAKPSDVEPLSKLKTPESSPNGKKASRFLDIGEQAKGNSECPEYVAQTPDVQPVRFSPAYVDDATNETENQDIMFDVSMQPEMEDPDAVVHIPLEADKLFVEREIEKPETESNKRTEAEVDPIQENSETSGRMHDDYGCDTFDGNTIRPDEIQEPREERASANSEMNASSVPDTMPEKLDFLQERRETAAAVDEGCGSVFVGDADMYDRRKGKYNQTYSPNEWSVRTKAVANYLKRLFEKLEKNSGSERPAQVSLQDLLKGRTRKEAARMYFETLVLTSRDFLNVEQTTSFGEIRLSGTPLLRKEIP